MVCIILVILGRGMRIIVCMIVRVILAVKHLVETLFAEERHNHQTRHIDRC